MAIQLSMVAPSTPMRASHPPRGPESDLRTREVLMDEGDEVEVPASPASAPVATLLAQPRPNRKFCAICQSECPTESVSCVSFCCSHEYCNDCILGCFKSRTKPIVECPGCRAEHNSQSFHIPHIPTAAVGLIDPHFVHHIDGMEVQLEGGVQLRPFLRMGIVIGGTVPSCPRCNCIIPSGINVQRPQILRCWRPDCGLVFCRNCCRPWHGGDPCVIDSKVLEDREFVRENSKPCPRCSAPVVHPRYHGCHRMHCPSCSYHYCYLCSAPVIEGENGDEMSQQSACQCPIYCKDGCSCPSCIECKPGKPCSNCDGSCNVCRP